MSTATALRGDERVSHRDILTADQVEQANFDIVGMHLEGLRMSVGAVTAGRPVRSRLYYLTYEEVVGFPPAAPEGEAA